MTSRDKFRDAAYREAYAESFLDTFIATQIRVIREQRGWTQAELAEATGMRQSRISTLEDANYSKWSLSTLKRIARAFKVPLQVSFGTFGSLLTEVDAFGRRSLERVGFDDDPAFSQSSRDTKVEDATATSALVAAGATTGNVLPFVARARHNLTFRNDTLSSGSVVSRQAAR